MAARAPITPSLAALGCPFNTTFNRCHAPRRSLDVELNDEGNVQCAMCHEAIASNPQMRAWSMCSHITCLVCTAAAPRANTCPVCNAAGAPHAIYPTVADLDE